MITKLNKNLKIAVLLAGLACSGAAQAGIVNRTVRLAVHLLPLATNLYLYDDATYRNKYNWYLKLVKNTICSATNIFPQILFGFKDEQMKIAAGNPTKIKFEIKDFCAQISGPPIFALFKDFCVEKQLITYESLISLNVISSSNTINLFYGLSGRDSVYVLIGRHIAQQRHAEKLEKEQRLIQA